MPAAPPPIMHVPQVSQAMASHSRAKRTSMPVLTRIQSSSASVGGAASPKPPPRALSRGEGTVSADGLASPQGRSEPTLDYWLLGRLVPRSTTATSADPAPAAAAAPTVASGHVPAAQPSAASVAATNPTVGVGAGPLLSRGGSAGDGRPSARTAAEPRVAGGEAASSQPADGRAETDRGSSLLELHVVVGGLSEVQVGASACAAREHGHAHVHMDTDMHSCTLGVGMGGARGRAWAARVCVAMPPSLDFTLAPFTLAMPPPLDAFHAHVPSPPMHMPIAGARCPGAPRSRGARGGRAGDQTAPTLTAA